MVAQNEAICGVVGFPREENPLKPRYCEKFTETAFLFNEAV
jgi:hypothetical protein